MNFDWQLPMDDPELLRRLEESNAKGHLGDKLVDLSFLKKRFFRHEQCKKLIRALASFHTQAELERWWKEHETICNCDHKGKRYGHPIDCLLVQELLRRVV